MVVRLHLKKGIEDPTTMDLKVNLYEAWGFQYVKVVPMGGDYFHVVISSMEDQAVDLAYGPINASPGTFRVTRL